MLLLIDFNKRYYNPGMAVSISDVKKYLKERDHKEKLQRQHLFELATSEFDKMVEHIITNYNNITVYQWGSLMNPEDFDENSDIDIAVEGIKSAEVFFKLYGELMKMTEFPLDFVELERIDILHQKSIKEKGRLVYGGS